MINAACEVVAVFFFVIPGRADRRGPGIHTPQQGLWIPGSPLCGAPE